MHKPLDMEGIRNHWHDWATRFATDLRATTKTATIKKLELAAFARALRTHGPKNGSGSVLEVGCGNGLNCLSLARLFPALRFTGVDYVPAMVDSARLLLKEAPELAGRVDFRVADALALGADNGLPANFSAVFTDRCLINLNTWELQAKAIDGLIGRVAPGGLLLMIENVTQTHQRQNELRVAAGLPARAPAEYNLFFDEERLKKHLSGRMELVGIEDFGSLHDLLLYVLVPMSNGGHVDYAHPLVEAATELSLVMDGALQCGAYGQNRLFVYRRPG